MLGRPSRIVHEEAHRVNPTVGRTNVVITGVAEFSSGSISGGVEATAGSTERDGRQSHLSEGEREVENRVVGDQAVENLCKCRSVFTEGGTENSKKGDSKKGRSDDVGKDISIRICGRRCNTNVGRPGFGSKGCGRTCKNCRFHNCEGRTRAQHEINESVAEDYDRMKVLGPAMSDYGWPKTDIEAIDESLCYHSCRFQQSVGQVDISFYNKIPTIVNALERLYCSTKVRYTGWPRDFHKFIRESVDWNSSPGWPWKQQFPTNRDLFMFDGVNLSHERVLMVEAAVIQRWIDLEKGCKADPIHVFVKEEPHKKIKIKDKVWRLISGVGLTDSLVDRILYGNWLDKMIENWSEIPSKAGWTPQLGGFKWLAKAFRCKEPISIDKSSWDWTVNSWHVQVLMRLIPRMIFDRQYDGWDTVFNNRMLSLYGAGNVVFKPACGCEFTQLIDGIQKSGCLGTIAFNSILQVAIHLAAGGLEEDLIFSLGDDTVQERPKNIPLNLYQDNLRKTGAIVKETDEGWPIVFGGHVINETISLPSYTSKHMFQLLYLDERFGPETLESYRHLYALHDGVSDFLESLALRKYGPKDLLSREYLREWYLANE